MADPRRPIADQDRVSEELRQIKRRLDELERPTGTQQYQTVRRLTELVEDLQEKLEEWTSTRYTNAQIDQKIADAIATRLTQDQVDQRAQIVVASNLSGNVAIGGALNVSGAVTMPAVRTTSVSSESNRATVWVAGNGKVGTTA